MKNLTNKQIEIKTKIEIFSKIFGVDPAWATAIAFTESSLGEKQKSPTGCLGVFQMSTIAMKDLLKEMQNIDDDLIDIVCGIAFLRLLQKRWGSYQQATAHFCDPNNRNFYVDKVMKLMEEF